MIGPRRDVRLVLAAGHAADQNMIDGAFRGPAREGRKTDLRGSKTGELEQPAHFRGQQVAVEIPHQHQAGPVGQQLGKIRDLHAPRTGTQRQVGNGDIPGQSLIGEFREQHPPAGYPTGQDEMLDLERFQARQQGVAGAGEGPGIRTTV